MYCSSGLSPKYEDDMLPQSPHQFQHPNVENIKHGTYVSVKFNGLPKIWKYAKLKLRIMMK